MPFENQALNTVEKSYLEWIHNEDHYERIELYKENENYYDGDIDIKLPSNVKAILSKEFGFSGNICKSVVDAAVGFLSKEPLSIEIKVPRGEDEDELEDDRSAAEAFIYDIFRDSKLLIKNYLKALRIQGKKGEFALKAHRVLDDNGNVESYKISVLRPDICFPKWKNEEYEEMEYFAIKYTRNNPETGKREWFAQVIWPNLVKEFIKPIDADDATQWKKIDEWETGYDFIPVEWVQNKADDGPWAEADITLDLKQLQDAFNKTITDLVYTADFESFRTAFILGASPPIDKETGKPAKIKGGPGKIHWIEGNGERPPQLDSIPASDFEGLHDTIDKFLDVVSVVSKVPKIELNNIGSTGSVPTGVALRTLYQAFIGKTNEKSNLFKSGCEGIIYKIFKMAEADGISTDFNNYDYNAVIHIYSGLPKDEKEQAEVHQIEDQNDWKSKETIMQERGVEDIDKEKEKINQERTESDVYGDRLNQELNNITGGEGAEE